MSLVGNLEDLGLGEILQIVNLSRKSGVLELSSRQRTGRIFFRAGQIVRVTASTAPEHLGDLLLRAGLVDLDVLRRALSLQREVGGGLRIGDILVERFGLDRAAIDAVVCQHIERIICKFFTWTDGSFVFELGEAPELAAVNLDPLQLVLDNGLNPQWLALEGARRVDERKEEADAPADDNDEAVLDIERLLTEPPPPVPAVPPAPPAACFPPERCQVLVVDDDPLTAEQLARQLQARRAAVRVFTSASSFLAAVDQADPATTLLLVDLFMPRRDGGALPGGLELLEAIGRRAAFPVLAVAEHVTGEAEESVRRFGGTVLLRKPGREEVRSGAGAADFTALLDALVALARGAVPAGEGEACLVDIGAELSRELGADSELIPRQSRQSPGLHLLRGMLEELGNPSLGGGIILLILRFASELMNRAVIFLVREHEIVGLGQFGIVIPGGPADARVRSMRIPTAAESLFSGVLHSRCAARAVPADLPWNSYLFEQLGGQVPREAFVGPLISEGRVVAILYGDNLPMAQPVGDTETLEIFLAQAGVAMEKALLERRLTHAVADG